MKEVLIRELCYNLEYSLNTPKQNEPTPRTTVRFIFYTRNLPNMRPETIGEIQWNDECLFKSTYLSNSKSEREEHVLGQILQMVFDLGVTNCKTIAI